MISHVEMAVLLAMVAAAVAMARGLVWIDGWLTVSEVNSCPVGLALGDLSFG